MQNSQNRHLFGKTLSEKFVKPGKILMPDLVKINTIVFELLGGREVLSTPPHPSPPSPPSSPHSAIVSLKDTNYKKDTWIINTYIIVILHIDIRNSIHSIAILDMLPSSDHDHDTALTMTMTQL